MIVATALLLAASTGCAIPTADADAQLALDYVSFDARSDRYGWRTLNASGCTDEAVALLTRYASANDARLSAEARRELTFHAGQALAFAGRDAESISNERRTRPHPPSGASTSRRRSPSCIAMPPRWPRREALTHPPPAARCDSGSSTDSSPAWTRRTGSQRTAGCDAARRHA